MLLSRRDVAEGATLLAITLYGLDRRLIELAKVGNTRLDPDTFLYRHIAAHMRTPYSTLWREPGWPWIIRTWMVPFGTSAAATRTLTVMLSVAMIVAVWWVGRRLSGRRAVGLIAAVFTAASLPLIEHSPRGLRLEAWCLALLAFIYAALEENLPPRRRAVYLWASGAASLLINLASITLIVPVVVYVGWRRGLGARSTIAVLLGMAILVAPHTLHEYRSYGDPFYSSNHHAVFYRNLEFVRFGNGCPGCPTPAEYQRNFYSGSRTTWLHYMFGLHSTSTVIRRVGDGFQMVYVTDDPLFQRGLGGVVRVFWLVGVVVLLLRRKQRLLLVIPVLVLGGTAFVVPVPAFDWRLVFHVAPLIFLVAAIGVVAAGDASLAAYRRLRTRREASSVA
jgi:hypothetical protein